MFEHRSRPLLPRAKFFRRVLLFLLIGTALDLLVLCGGAIGFRLSGDLAWADAALEAAMVMTGNGPRHSPRTLAGEFFLSAFALVGGIAYVVVIGLILAPALHRLAHSFHLRGPGAS